MMTRRALRRWISRAAGGWRRLTGRRTDIDYRRWYATWDLRRDYWTIVGPTSKKEFDRLGAIKRQLLLDLGMTPNSKVLDVGCGTGMLTAALHDYLSEDGLYHGTDISPEAVAFCRSRFRRPNFFFQTSTMTTLPLENASFDFIVFYSVFTHTYPDETALLLREARRLLAEEGLIFADVFTASLADSHAGGRAAVEVNVDYFLRLVDACELRAEVVKAQPRPLGGQRLFFKFTRPSHHRGR
jgi:SAM-dependent methyltransferase